MMKIDVSEAVWQDLLTLLRRKNQPLIRPVKFRYPLSAARLIAAYLIVDVNIQF